MDVFDQIIAGQVPAEVIVRTEAAIAFLDNHPLFPGHALVCPVEPYRTLYDLPEPLLPELLKVARQVGAAQCLALEAEGTFLANNNVISQSVPHFHLHVVPRRKGDGLKGFFWPRTHPSADQLHVVADRLRAAIDAGGAS